MLNKSVIDRAYEALGALVQQRAELEAHVELLTEKGCVQASLHWREDKYLYLLYPVGSEMGKSKEYIGVNEAKQKEAQARVERWGERERVRAKLRDLAGYITRAEKALTLLADGLEAKVKNEELESWSDRSCFDQLLRSVNNGW